MRANVEHIVQVGLRALASVGRHFRAVRMGKFEDYCAWHNNPNSDRYLALCGILLLSLQACDGKNRSQNHSTVIENSRILSCSGRPTKDLKEFISGKKFVPVIKSSTTLIEETFEHDGTWAAGFGGLDINVQYGYWTVRDAKAGNGLICIRRKGRPDNCRKAYVKNPCTMIAEKFNRHSFFYEAMSVH